MNIDQKSYKPETLRYVIPVVMGVFGLFLLAGCTGTYGSLKRDAEVQQAFESNQVPPEYKYYYYGFDTRPYVIFGIDPDYELNSRVWREVMPEAPEFKEMIRWVWEDYNYNKFGADILDPQGKKVGVYYSAIRETAVKFVDDNQIIVMPHTPFLWGPDNIGGGGIRVR
ncbi:MAG: hypothetical protein PVH42_03605 [Desulfobacterales bacterium]|jgi:hypothetical protein